MRILITGIAGFVGSSVAKKLLERGHKITGIDDYSAGYKQRLLSVEQHINILEGRLEQILPTLDDEFDVIINCAAIAPLPANEIDHFNSISNNVGTCGR